jgi:hypothetical protein
MSNKYVRHQSVISRNADEQIDEDHWVKELQKRLEKGAVQPRPVDSFLFDQINSIMNNKSKYPSVEAAVLDMKERSGLTAYLDNLNKKSTDNNQQKTASDENNVIDKSIPLLLQKHPAAKTTIENYIRDTKGNLPVPAIIDKIRSIHQNDVSDAQVWDDDNLIRYVSKENLEAKQNNSGNYENYDNLGARDTLGDSELDPENTDAFHSLMPAKANKYYNQGIKRGQFNLENNHASDIISSIKSLGAIIPPSEYLSYAIGFAKGAKLSDSIKDKEIDKVLLYRSNIRHIKK